MNLVKKILMFLIVIISFSIPLSNDVAVNGISSNPEIAGEPLYSSPILITYQFYLKIGYLRLDKPLIIENLTINTNGRDPGIIVEDFESALIIRNCTIINTQTKEYAGAAIEIINSKNVIISNCSIVNTRSAFGIRIKDSKNIILTKSTVTGLDYGIYLNNSQNITVSNNKVSFNRLYNLYLDSSDENKILSNNITDGTENNGIYLYNSGFNNLSGNLVSNNKYSGIYLRSSDNNSISDNKIIGNSRGVYLHESNYNRITDNLMYDNNKPWEDYGGINNVFKNNSNENTIPGYMPLWILLFFSLGICVSITQILFNFSELVR